MPSSGAAGLAASLSGLQAAQTAAQYQAGVQRDVLDLQQAVIEQLFASLLQLEGIGANLDLTA